MNSLNLYAENYVEVERISNKNSLGLKNNIIKQ